MLCILVFKIKPLALSSDMDPEIFFSPTHLDTFKIRPR